MLCAAVVPDYAKKGIVYKTSPNAWGVYILSYLRGSIGQCCYCISTTVNCQNLLADNLASPFTDPNFSCRQEASRPFLPVCQEALSPLQ